MVISTIGDYLIYVAFVCVYVAYCIGFGNVMGKLDKYIFRQVFAAAFMTVALFVFVLVLGNIFRAALGELLAGRLGVSLFMYLVALLIPSVVPYALPMGMLTEIGRAHV